MPIIIQHQPSPAAVGVAAFVSGAGAAQDRRRKEQLALIERDRARLFQFGMQEREIGARRNAQEAGFAHDAGQQRALFQQQEELQKAGFANQGELQAAGFANQGELQAKHAADQERLWGMRGEQDAIAKAWDDIRTGKSELSPDTKQNLDKIRAEQDAITMDPFIPDDVKRSKLAESRRKELGALSTATPPKAPEPPKYEDSVTWPSGTPGRGVASQWNAKQQKWEHFNARDPVWEAQQKEAEERRKRIFKMQTDLRKNRLALGEVKDAKGNPLYDAEEIEGKLLPDKLALDALMQGPASQRPQGPAQQSQQGPEPGAGDFTGSSEGSGASFGDAADSTAGGILPPQTAAQAAQVGANLQRELGLPHDPFAAAGYTPSYTPPTNTAAPPAAGVYPDTYAAGVVKVPAAPAVATPQGLAEFDALPPGTRYRLPDGREGVK